VWHQFVPSVAGSHPAFFAISTYTDERYAIKSAHFGFILVFGFFFFFGFCCLSSLLLLLVLRLFCFFCIVIAIFIPLFNGSGGDLEAELKRKVLNNEADIAALTELLPRSVIDYMRENGNAPVKKPVLSIGAYLKFSSYFLPVCVVGCLFVCLFVCLICGMD
jgi:hypothetical protein